MKYWITAHWPGRTDEPPVIEHEGIYIPGGRQASVASMSVGDLVFIYESRSGRPEKRKLLDGRVVKIPCRIGREGIVTLSQTISAVYENEGTEPTEYYNGSKIWWRFSADTETLNSRGFVSREELNSILGYERAYNLRGFGDYHSGVKELTVDQFKDLLGLFNRGAADENAELCKRRYLDQREQGNPPGGEGALHKELKDKIAQNPSSVLQEEGLSLIAVEYEFVTGDRVDILLRDCLGRLVVVEVEPECQDDNEIGPAQCMKYRALMAFESTRRVSEIRSILAAEVIGNGIGTKSQGYGIETKEIR